MKILDRKNKQSNSDIDVVLVVVDGESRGWYHVNYVHLVEMKHDSVYKKVNGKDVVKRLQTYEINSNSSYSRDSRNARVLAEAQDAFNNAVKA